MRSIEATPPPPPRTTADDIIGHARRTRVWQSVALGSGVAAGLAVVVALSASAVARPDLGGPSGVEQAAQPTPQQSFTPPPATPTDPPLPVAKVAFRSDLSQYRVGEFRIGPAAEVTAGYTELPVYRDGVGLGDGSTFPLEVATITVYGKDVYDTNTFGGAGDATLTIGDRHSLSVNGREAWTRDWTYTSPMNTEKKWVMAALAWQHTDGAWATLLPNFGGSDLTREQAIQIATGLTRAAPRDLKVPYRLGFVPKGWQAVAVKQTPAKNSNAISTVILHHGPVADAATRIDEVLPGHLKISVMKGLEPGKVDYIKENGVHCSAGTERCAIIRGDYRIDLSGYGGTLSDADIQKVAQNLQLRDLADQNNWATVDF